MLSLDDQWIEEVLDSMGTTGHPYWTAVERWRRWHLCMMANLTWNLATAFSWRHATTAPSYHGLFVFRRECRWFYITWLLFSSGYSWWYTLWKFDSSILSNFCVLRGGYVEKSQNDRKGQATQKVNTSMLVKLFHNHLLAHSHAYTFVESSSETCHIHTPLLSSCSHDSDWGTSTGHGTHKTQVTQCPWGIAV